MKDTQAASSAERLRALLLESRSIVFFGGAGISTESGIPDFRSVDGLYHQKYDYPPETILSHSFFERYPEEFYRFYREKMLFPQAMPNQAHRALAAWEAAGRLRAVVTQNIDGLHQKAGSKRVYELHGSVLRNRCTRCGAPSGLETILGGEGLPRCHCGGLIKPEVVLYEEALDSEVMEGALEAIRACDLLLVGGTSLAVYPAAGLVRYAPGRVVVLNRTPTPLDAAADLTLAVSIGAALEPLIDIFDEA